MLYGHFFCHWRPSIEDLILLIWMEFSLKKWEIRNKVRNKKNLFTLQLLIPQQQGHWHQTSWATTEAQECEWVASLFSSRSSQSRNRTRVSCTASRFFTIREVLLRLTGVKHFCCIRLRIKDYCLPGTHYPPVTDLPVYAISRPLSGFRSKSWVDLPPTTLMLTPARPNCCVLLVAFSSLPDTPFPRLNKEPENKQQRWFHVGRCSTGVVHKGKAVKRDIFISHIPLHQYHLRGDYSPVF